MHSFFYKSDYIHFYKNIITIKKTLAIETSCDDTSIGIVWFDGSRFEVEELVAYSQIQEHNHYGGVVPELAYRSHENKIIWLIEQIWYDKIASCDSISVTKFPWLPWSLVVGNAVANTLWSFLDKSVLEINHIYWHIFSALLERNIFDLPLPWLVLTASGWHNEIYLITTLDSISNDFKLHNLNIHQLWHTLDDAAWEAFDKVARMLWWDYPWWPWISSMATHWKPNPQFDLKKVLLDKKDNLLNFSFSGMKAQVRRLLELHPLETLSQQDIYDICYSFEQTVDDILVHKIASAQEIYDARSILLVWWVSANDLLYEKLKLRYEDKQIDLWSDLNIFTTDNITIARPAKKVYSTDNAAMIWVVGLLS